MVGKPWFPNIIQNKNHFSAQLEENGSKTDFFKTIPRQLNFSKNEQIDKKSTEKRMVGKPWFPERMVRKPWFPT